MSRASMRPQVQAGMQRIGDHQLYDAERDARKERRAQSCRRDAPQRKGERE